MMAGPLGAQWTGGEASGWWCKGTPRLVAWKVQVLHLTATTSLVGVLSVPTPVVLTLHPVGAVLPVGSCPVRSSPAQRDRPVG